VQENLVGYMPSIGSCTASCFGKSFIHLQMHVLWYTTWSTDSR